MATQRGSLDEHSSLLPRPPSSDSTNVIISDTRSSLSLWNTCVEIVVILIFFSKILSDTLVVNFLEYKTCTVVYKFNNSICIDPIPAPIENIIQPRAANILLMRTFIESLIPSIFVLFVGPWSDSNGRKPFLILSIAGLSASYALWGIISLFPDVRPEYYLLASIPVSFTGGICTLFTALYCYICDVTTIEDRAIRIAMLHFVYNLGNFFGQMSAPQIFDSIPRLPYTMIFTISSGVLMIAVVFVAVCISESIIIQPERQRNLLQVDHLQKLFTICFMKRRQHVRSMILLLAGSLGVTVFISQGEGNILYLSLREMFGWQLESYSFYSSYTLILNSFGGLVGVWLFVTLLDLPTMPLAVVVTLCRTGQAVLNAIAVNDTYFYIAGAIGCVIYMLGSLVRLEASKLMPQQDIGKVMAFIAFLEALCPIIAAPLYTFLYDATLATHPESIFWLSTVLSLFPVIFILIVIILQYAQPNFSYEGVESMGVHV